MSLIGIPISFNQEEVLLGAFFVIVKTGQSADHNLQVRGRVRQGGLRLVRQRRRLRGWDTAGGAGKAAGQLIHSFTFI